MSKARHKSRRPKGKRHKRIPIHQKELVIQLKSMGLTYNEVANRAKLGYATCEWICTKWAKDNPDSVKTARAQAMEALAGKLNEKALLALDHITPDSLTHDRIVRRDEDGNVTAVIHSGPTALQSATAAGILLDKSEKAMDKAAIMRGETPDTLGPGSLHALLDSIKGRMTRLTQVNADIDTGAIQAHIIELEDRVSAEDNYTQVEIIEEDSDEVQE